LYFFYEHIRLIKGIFHSCSDKSPCSTGESGKFYAQAFTEKNSCRKRAHKKTKQGVKGNFSVEKQVANQEKAPARKENACHIQEKLGYFPGLECGEKFIRKV